MNENVKKSLEKSKNVLEEKRKIVKRKICIKKDTQVYKNCYELRSRATKQTCYLVRWFAFVGQFSSQDSHSSWTYSCVVFCWTWLAMSCVLGCEKLMMSLWILIQSADNISSFLILSVAKTLQKLWNRSKKLDLFF